MHNKWLAIALSGQAAMQAAAASAALAEIAPRPVVAAVSLLSAMLASGTAAYVAATGRISIPPVQPMAPTAGAMDDRERGTPAPSGR